MSETKTNQNLKTGDYVRILDADPGTPDPKNLVYYSFYKGLAGNVVKAYDDGTVAVSIDRSTLPEPIRLRHEQSEQAQGNRWLNSLSDEERNRLTDRERQFSLRYTLLIKDKQLVPEKQPSHSR